MRRPRTRRRPVPRIRTRPPPVRREPQGWPGASLACRSPRGTRAEQTPRRADEAPQQKCSLAKQPNPSSAFRGDSTMTADPSEPILDSKSAWPKWGAEHEVDGRGSCGGLYLDFEAEVTETGYEAASGGLFVLAVGEGRAEVVIGDVAEKDVVGGREHGGGDGDDGLLAATASLGAVVLGPGVRLLLAGSGPCGLHQSRLQPGVAGAKACGAMLAGALIASTVLDGTGSDLNTCIVAPKSEIHEFRSDPRSALSQVSPARRRAPRYGVRPEHMYCCAQAEVVNDFETPTGDI